MSALNTSPTPASDACATGPVRQRQRLSPDERIPQILDAALQEFSAKGFIATRMEDIAARAGLSKGGLYAHFTGKDAVFEALIQRSLAATALDSEALLANAQAMEQVLAPLLTQLYGALASPPILATMRLLLSEGHRLPSAAVERRETTISGLLSQIDTLLQRCAERGWCRRESVLLREPWMLISPVVHLLTRQIAFQPLAPAELEAAKSAHLALLKELLSLA